MTAKADPAAWTCFFEQDPQLALGRRAAVEGVGTLLLMLAVAGSGLAAQRLGDAGPGSGLLAGAVATAAALVGLIVAFGKVSGGHFNPLITGLQWLAGERRLDCTLAYLAAQILGAGLGAGAAGIVFGSPTALPLAPEPGWRLWASEALATAGLMAVVFGCIRSKRAEVAPFAVGAWLTAAIVATPSASYANPAVTIAALWTSGPTALPAGTVAAYLTAQLTGALAAWLLIGFAYPADSVRQGSLPQATDARS
ncbi:aquaporin [Geminicoccus roseus]|uniref:aquaporin n=1 Tax=Geminicoccus roseus TaxID=404900 RepID=UPI000404CDEB|nr:aquaporin [Geminicoccus roseus]